MKPSKNIKLAKAKADKYFADYIRQRDKERPCVTCGGWGQKDAGHFISRRFESTRYDEKNVNGQCIKCNRFEYGNQFEHAKEIDRRYGAGTADSLLLKSKMQCKRTKYDYEYLAKYYREKLS